MRRTRAPWWVGSEGYCADGYRPNFVRSLYRDLEPVFVREWRVRHAED